MGGDIPGQGEAFASRFTQPGEQNTHELTDHAYPALQVAVQDVVPSYGLGSPQLSTPVYNSPLFAGAGVPGHAVEFDGRAAQLLATQKPWPLTGLDAKYPELHSAKHDPPIGPE